MDTGQPYQARITVANAARIPCSLRTLAPRGYNGNYNTWVHVGEMMDALLYLSGRLQVPEGQTRALKEALEELSSSINAASVSRDQAPGEKESTDAQSTHNSPAGN